MQESEFENLEDIADHVSEHLVPAIEQAVEVCVRSHGEDPFNDNWTFGTQLWKNVWNRFAVLAGLDECPFGLFGKGNEYKLKIGPFVLRHHRIDRKTTIPKAARAAKSAAAVQLMLFDDEWDLAVAKDNIIIAVDADVDDGLREIFVGELTPDSAGSNKYKWAKKIPVFLAEGTTPSSEEFVKFAEAGAVGPIVPEEEIPEVSVGFDESKIVRTAVERDGE